MPRRKPNSQAITRAIRQVLKAENSRAPNKAKRKRSKRAKAMTLLETSTPTPSVGVAAAYGFSLPPNLGKPTRNTQSHGGEIISNCELVISQLNFPATTGFGITSFLNVNPADLNIFSWLGPLAQLYQLYAVRKLDIYYIPIAGSTTQGNTLVAAYYNVNTVAPTGETSMMSTRTKHAGVVWTGYHLPLDCDSMNSAGKKKTRNVTSGGDQNVYNCAKIFFGGVNAANNSGLPMGKIYIDYEFEFWDPISSSNVSVLPANTALYYTPGQALTTSTPTRVAFTLESDPFNFGAQGTYGGRNNSWNPPPGYWLITYSISVSDTANEVFTINTYVQQNGSGTDDPGSTQLMKFGAGPSVGHLSGQTILFIPDENQDFALYVFAIGAAGTLSVSVNGSITFSPA